MSFRNGMLDQRMQEQNKKKNNPRPNDDEETDMEMERAMRQALNKQRSVFDNDEGNRQGGINTAPSIFDRKAVFRISDNEG